jgi:AcrR family transcriptional regulator
MQAMIDLAVERKGFADVTVSDIAERAMINRATFYRHFLDKCDLVEQYMDEVYALASIADAESPHVVATPPSAPRPPAGLLITLRHVQANSAFYCVMLGAKGDPGFTERFRQNCERRYRHLFATSTKIVENEPNSPPLDLRIDYISYAAVGAIVWWLESEQPCTPEQLAVWISQLMISRLAIAPHQVLDAHPTTT